MNITRKTTPPQNIFERYCHCVPFKVEGNQSLIESLSSENIIVRVDRTQQMACARFDNTDGFNELRKRLGVVVI